MNFLVTKDNSHYLHGYYCGIRGCRNFYDFSWQPFIGIIKSFLPQLWKSWWPDDCFCSSGMPTKFLLKNLIFAIFQIECFLRKLTELRAKYKLVAFTDFTPLYNQDTILSFYYNFMIVYLQKHEKYHEDLEFFKNPLDVKYGDFLHRLTPSFLVCEKNWIFCSKIWENRNFELSIIRSNLVLKNIEIGSFLNPNWSQKYSIIFLTR